MYDQGPKLGMRRKRNCAEDSATVKGKRPDFFLLSSRALLFKGEDKTSEAEGTGGTEYQAKRMGCSCPWQGAT